MSEKKKHSGQVFTRDRILLGALFIFLWVYLIIRANTVFYIHDELVTKWAYMINWNPWPYHGYMDANNHFLNSLLGGLFIRLIDSDAMWVVRLGNLLSFPLFFWSLYRLKEYYTDRLNFYATVVSISVCTFLLEYFALARGYGMSMAWLCFALYHTMACVKHVRFYHVACLTIGWMLSVYANLTMLPLALFGSFYTLCFLWTRSKLKWSWIIILSIGWYVYAALYSLELRDIGKLYLGKSSNFVANTVQTLTPYIWNTDHISLSYLLIGIFILCISGAVIYCIRNKNVFNPRLVFPIFLTVSIVGIFLQNLLLGVNFPHTRAALFLIVLFFGTVPLLLDIYKIKWAGLIVIAISTFFFIKNMNLEKSVYFYYEHFDKELLTQVPDNILGIPPSTGARFWRMDNGRTQEEGLTVRAFQDAPEKSDTLFDYIITTQVKRPDITERYNPVYRDSISDLTLFERKSFLPRKFLDKSRVTFNGDNEYHDLYRGVISSNLFIRVKGTFNSMDRYKHGYLVCTSEDEKGKTVDYVSVPVTETGKINNNGDLPLDLTITLSKSPSAKRLKVYIWNRYKTDLSGSLETELYTIQ